MADKTIAVLLQDVNFHQKTHDEKIQELSMVDPKFAVQSDGMKNQIMTKIRQHALDTVYKDMPWGEVAVEGIKQIPSSLKNEGMETLNAFAPGPRVGGLRPKGQTLPFEQVLRGAGGLIVGLVQKVIPGEQNQEHIVDVVWNDLVDTYGGEAELKRSLVETPGRVIMDAATITTAAGTALKAAGASRAGSVVSNIGKYMEPTSPLAVGVRAVERVFIPKGLPQRLYQSSLKIPRKKGVRKQDTLLNAGLEYPAWRAGALPTRRGMEALGQKIKGLQDTIDTTIQPGQKLVSTDLVLQRVDDLRADLVRKGASKRDLRAIDSVRKDFENIAPGSFIDAKRAQEIKTGKNTRLKKMYGEMKSAQIEAEKSIVRGLKEELEDIYPELKTLNAAQGEAIELSNALSNAFMGHRAQNIVGISILSPLAHVADNPALKAALGRALHRARNHVIGNPRAAAKLGIYQLGQNERAQQKHYIDVYPKE